ncbi:MAG TPA: PIG-L family deacetylase [Opitutaceae bacterium]|nr:PIG-L family deacetylase [Opitutaceae bacterium]
MTGARTDLRLGVRRALNLALRVPLRLRSRRYWPDRTHRYVVIAPHPDDETIGCGGLIAACRRLEAPVDVVFLTDGSASLPDHPALGPSQLAALRAREARAALAILGVEAARLHFMGWPDGRLAHLDLVAAAAGVAALASLLRQLQPDEIVLPWRRDGSSEHEAAFTLVRRAVAAAGLAPVWLEFPVWAWWSPRLLVRFLRTATPTRRLPLGGDRATKARALAQYQSQIAPVPPWCNAALPAGFADLFLGPNEYFATPLP